MTLDASTGNTYTVTFALPLPARAFWSLTMYEAARMLLVNNTINRYSIGDSVSAVVNSMLLVTPLVWPVLRCAALCCAVLRCAALCCAVLCCAMLCCAVLSSALLCLH